MKKEDWHIDAGYKPHYILWALDSRGEVVICCTEMTWEKAEQEAQGLLERNLQVSCVVIERSEAPVLVDVVRREG